MKLLAKILYQKTLKYFQDEKNHREFRKRYKDTYGKVYQEKKIGGSND